MSFATSRVLAKRQPLRLLRNASTVSEATSGARGAAKQATSAIKDSVSTSKASEGLSRVTSSAGNAVSKVGGAAASTLSSVGGRTGRLINFVNSLIPPTIYYSRVGLELSKMIAHGQKMAPPTGAQFQSYGQSLLKMMRNPSSITAGVEANPQEAVQGVRRISRAQMAVVGVVLAEVLGFFSVGEMIGRFKIIGYRSSAPHGEGH